MSERTECRRNVGGRVDWGFDAFGMFFSFDNQVSAHLAATTWTDEFLLQQGGLPIAACPLVE